ncbi:unnamed protein product [Clavelina lepadiformis]|uniref:Uncharacterized protein n=1 Tax=Clavelina lepadiformis TaxID=159417 RepID=A0ABP0GRV3_CLALP
MCFDDRGTTLRSACGRVLSAIIFTFGFVIALAVNGGVQFSLGRVHLGIGLLSVSVLLFVSSIVYGICNKKFLNLFSSEAVTTTTNETGRSHVRNLHLPQSSRRCTTDELHRCRQHRLSVRADQPVNSEQPPSYESLHQAQVTENLQGLSNYLPTYEEVV